MLKILRFYLRILSEHYNAVAIGMQDWRGDESGSRHQSAVVARFVSGDKRRIAVAASVQGAKLTSL